MHPQLRNRAAALLLRLGGEESQEQRARVVDWTFGASNSYEDDYEKDPARSMFNLERRHVDIVLRAESLPAWRRLEKVEEFLADPAIELPDDLLQFLADSLNALTPARLHRGTNRTMEEHQWERLRLRAARFLPVPFTAASRRELQGVADRKGEQKYWSVLHLQTLLLLCVPEDVPALRALRTNTTLERYDELINALCLQLEILHMPCEEQLEYLHAAGHYRATIDLLKVIRPVSPAQLQHFLESHQASEQAARVVLEVMALQQTQGATTLAEKLLHTLASESEEIRRISFQALSLCAPQVCGQWLVSKGWKADATDALVSHYGSDALAHASHALNLEDLLPLIAPWRWLDAVVARGSQPAELKSASCSLVKLVMSESREIAEPLAQIALYAREVGGLPRIGISELKKQETRVEDLLRKFNDTPDEADHRMEELTAATLATIREIRARGQSFYLQAFKISTLRAAYRSAPGTWNTLLTGAREKTPDFIKRVRAAEGLYMALCEVLLELDPEQGALLWGVLPDVVRTNMKGEAGISEFIHMIFRAPHSAEIERLRENLKSFASTSTDVAILDLVIAAQLNGCDDWLDRLIRQDRTSPYQWRHKRGLMLEAFRCSPDPQTLNWPVGWPTTSHEWLSNRMAYWRNRGELARLWWSKFLDAPDARTAFAAWTVFLSCADRRAYIWMTRLPAIATTNPELTRLRELHTVINSDLLERSLAAREQKANELTDHLFGLDSPGHWLEMDTTAR